jgi:NDP-sugar pyrophosphorylase family protein
MPMVELVARSLRPARAHRFTFLVLKDHVDRFGFDRLLHGIDPSARIVTVDTVTEGAACTVLLARDAIDSDDPLMLANSDQWVDMNINEYLAALDGGGADGLIMTMTADDPKWSYVGLDSRGRVNRVVEKQVISLEATVGIYNFRRGRIDVYSVGSVSERMWGLGTPADLELFIRSEASSAAIARAQRAGAGHS